jgi:hypothetical protein
VYLGNVRASVSRYDRRYNTMKLEFKSRGLRIIEWSIVGNEFAIVKGVDQ